jgi:hypothetical protein
MTFQNPRVLDLGRVVHADADMVRELRARAEAVLA